MEGLGAHAGTLHALDHRAEAARACIAATSTMVAAATFEVDVLSGVGEQRQPVECSQHEDLLVERVLGECRSDSVHPAHP